MSQLIRLRQLDQDAISGFALSIASGNISGIMQNYFTDSGFLGNHVVYSTGGNQTVLGIKTFVSSPLIPYSGSSGSAVSLQCVLDQISNLSTTVSNNFLTKTGLNENISGVKRFTVPVFVATPTDSGHAATKQYVDSLGATGLDSRFIGKTGTQNFSGQLHFTGTLIFTGANPGGASSSIMFYDGVHGSPTRTEIYPYERWLVIDPVGAGDVGNNIWINPINCSIEDFNPTAGISFASGFLYDVNRAQRVNWLDRVLSGRWTASSGFNISGNNVITGAVFKQGVGGTSVNGVIIISGSGMNVSGSSQIFNPRVTGINGTVVIRSGDNTILISGGSSSSTTITGSSTLTAPNYIGASGTRVIRSGANDVLITSEPLRPLTSFYLTSGINNGVNFQGFLFPGTFGIKPTVTYSINHPTHNDIISHQMSGLSPTGFHLVFGSTISVAGYEVCIFATTGSGFYEMRYF